MSYNVNGKEYKMYSNTNQRIIDKFVDREVYSNVTDMVEFILQNSYVDTCGEPPFTNDDIVNAYVDNSDKIEELKDELEGLETEKEGLETEKEELETEKEELESELEELEGQLEETREEFEEEPQRTELRDDIKSMEEEIEKINSKLYTMILDRDEIDDKILELEEQYDEIEREIDTLEDEQDEPNEVYCWYLVSGWLCNKLKDRGEVVIEDENLWGRGTCGQSISLDWVIVDICKEIEILEGQDFSWENK